MAIVKVGLVQMSCTADVAVNKAKAISKIREAAKQGAQIICLQELYTSLYFCDVEAYENFKLAEPIPGKTTDELSLLSKELNIVIIASLFEKRAEGLYHNTTAVFEALLPLAVWMFPVIFVRLEILAIESRFAEVQPLVSVILIV